MKARSNLSQRVAQAPRPLARRLRGYAFDPSLASRLETASISEIMYAVPWEELTPGPSGEYVEVVDFDPPSGCWYAPVDLNDPFLLAQNGLAPADGNPQFHQQMTYAVSMTTIERFERALGRRAFWADRPTEADPSGYVQRLRIYPHALRDANAYYSRDHGALLFGYFPATHDRRSGELPGGVVFTCLSHDVIAHETTHALLDGFHEHFLEDTNPDVLAFHEAFADIVALFQHFTFQDQLRDQIARTRGDLGSRNFLAQIAAQFGQANGARGALRDYIGTVDPETHEWRPHDPDPADLDNAVEVHDRGAILVAAVFDAFLSVYRSRTRDLLRIATGGTGELGSGEIHPDLVRRLAAEASKIAGNFLNICIRALDYCPPVDITFGEYLRAMITADMDLLAYDPRRYRIALIEAFRRRGIYPQGVRTLSEDSLRWDNPEDPTIREEGTSGFLDGIGLRQRIDSLRYIHDRAQLHSGYRNLRADIHDAILDSIQTQDDLQRLTGIYFTDEERAPGIRYRKDGSPLFSVGALHEARRLCDDGRILNQVFMTLLQKRTVETGDGPVEVRCGSTLVIDLDDLTINYAIRKAANDTAWLDTVARHRAEGDAAQSLRVYARGREVSLAALHRG